MVRFLSQDGNVLSCVGGVSVWTVGSYGYILVIDGTAQL